MEGTFSSRFSAYCINFDFDAVQEIWTVVDHMVSDGCLMYLTAGGFRMLCSDMHMPATPSYPAAA